MPIRIGITLGDPAGIGPEVIEKAFGSGKLRAGAEFQVIGERGTTKAGEPSKDSARAALGAMEEAARRAGAGELDAVVTGPIHKARMAEIGFPFPGQTEFFAQHTGTTNYAMLLTAGTIIVALVTTHIPLREVPGSLRTSEVVRIGKLLADFLERRGINSPRIAVAGLNPHAGESGRLGTEEIGIITPAVRELNSSLVTRQFPLKAPSPPTHSFTISRKVDGMPLCACITTRDSFRSSFTGSTTA